MKDLTREKNISPSHLASDDILIDNLSKIIINSMRNNSRQRIVAISRLNNFSVLDVFEKYNQLKSSIIIKNCSLINYEQTSYRYRFFIIVGFKHYINSANELSKSENMLIDFLKLDFNTNNISLTENGLIVDALFDTLQSYNIFIKRIKEFDILSLDIHPVEETLLVENFLT